MMAEKYYAYAVARIRTKELGLLKGAFLEQLLGAKSYEECIQLLSEKGWGDGTTMDAEQILRGEEEKKLADAVDRGVEAVKLMVTGQTDKAMNLYNG